MLIGDVEEGELRGVEHGTADPGARSAQRQQQRDLHRVAGRRGGGGRRGQDRRRSGRENNRRSDLQGRRRRRYPATGATVQDCRQTDGQKNGACRLSIAAGSDMAAKWGTGQT